MEIIRNKSNLTIIAVGGGFPLNEENILLMKKTTVIFINTDFDSILSRLNKEERAKRPLVAVLDSEGMKNLYKERYKIYKNTADFVAKNEAEAIECIKKVVF